jgi:hypothetical protein
LLFNSYDSIPPWLWLAAIAQRSRSREKSQQQLFPWSLRSGLKVAPFRHQAVSAQRSQSEAIAEIVRTGLQSFGVRYI